MTLNHSKTWPTNTLAVVQLRVDSEGHIYSSLSNQDSSGIREGTESAMLLDNRQTTTQKLMLSEKKQPQEEFTLTKCNNNHLNVPIKTNVCEAPGTNSAGPDDDGKIEKANGGVLPLSRKHLEMLAKISPPPPQFRATVRTDTVSTILDQELEFDYEPAQDED